MRKIIYFAVALFMAGCSNDGTSDNAGATDTAASVSPPPAGIEGDLDTGTGMDADTGTGVTNGTGGATGN